MLTEEAAEGRGSDGGQNVAAEEGATSRPPSPAAAFRMERERKEERALNMLREAAEEKEEASEASKRERRKESEQSVSRPFNREA